MVARRLSMVSFTLLMFVAFTGQGYGQDLFYKGKNIRLIEAYSAGGGYDTYARLIARHLGKHIPGNPAVTVENMTGAGGLIAVNFLYNRAEPDGLTIANWNGSLSLQQYLGLKGIEFDAPRFEWIGSALRPTPICIVARASGVTSLQEWAKAKKPVKLGGMAPGTSPSDDARILKDALALPMQLVEGYKGGADIKLAAKQGEVDGACGLAWETQKVTWRQELETMNVVVQVVRKAHPELAKVPLAGELAKNDEARQLLKVGIQDLAALGHAYTLPPKTRKNLVEVLRKAFDETLKDSDFLAEAEKANIVTHPVPGKELEEIVAGFAKLPGDLLVKLRSSLLPKQ